MTDRESGSKPPAGGESARPSRARRLRIPVAAAPVKLGKIDIYLDALGTVTPVYTVTAASP
jgi:hypothetical protein